MSTFPSQYGLNYEDPLARARQFERGRQLSAEDLNILAAERPSPQIQPARQDIPPTLGGGAATAVRIHRAIATLADANAYGDPKAVTKFQDDGPFLLCFTLDDEGNIPGPPEPPAEFRPFLAVLPSFNQDVDDFKNGPDQIFEAVDQEQPAYSVIEFKGAIRLMQGWGQVWSNIPDPGNLCQ